MSTIGADLISGLRAAAQDAVQSGNFDTADLFDSVRGADGKLPTDALRQVRHLRRRHERGRPPGATNKRSRKLAAWFVAKYGDPLDVLGEIMTTEVDVLVEELTLAQNGDAKHKPVRAIDAKRLIADVAMHVAPYIHGKQPVTVEVNGRKDAIIIIPGLNAPSDIPHDELQERIENEGLAAFDPLTLQMLPRPVPEDAEFEPVDADDGA